MRSGTSYVGWDSNAGCSIYIYSHLAFYQISEVLALFFLVLPLKSKILLFCLDFILIEDEEVTISQRLYNVQWDGDWGWGTLETVLQDWNILFGFLTT